MKYAVVDLETTGGNAKDGRIVEIGAVLLNGMEIEKTFNTLLDPGMQIQPFVQKLTGITDEMVQGKPQFRVLAEDLFQLLDGRIFVAHNVQYDSRFMTMEFKRCGIKFDFPKLCTVKISRRVFPGFESYSLHKLAKSLKIPEFNHHRALDDAMAATEILKMAIEKVGEETVLKEVRPRKFF